MTATNQISSKPGLRKSLALLAILFGLMTIKEGGSVLFVDGAARAAAGHYVPFVLWFNFVAGFFYVLTGVEILRTTSRAPRLAAAIALCTLLVFALLGAHVLSGGLYETRTVLAMTLRSSIWCGIALALRRSCRA